MTVTHATFPSVVAFPPGNGFLESDRHRCAFSRTLGRWALLADCELSAALDLPSHITLDGGGHTITLTGDAEGFESAAIRATGGDIVNLTVDGSQLQPLAPAYFAAIALAAPGGMTQTTVRNIRFSEAQYSPIGIEVAAFDGDTTVLQDITLENISGAGLLLTGDNQVTVERAACTGVDAAVQVTGTVTAHLSHVIVEHAHVGVLAQDQSRVRITAFSGTSERVAEDQAVIHHDTLIFIGAGDRERARRRAADAAMPADLLG